MICVLGGRERAGRGKGGLGGIREGGEASWVCDRVPTSSCQVHPLKVCEVTKHFGKLTNVNLDL